MYNKITPQKLKWLYIYKYFFQIFLLPIISGVIYIIIFFTVTVFTDGKEQAITDFFGKSQDPLFGIHNGCIITLIFSYILNAVNILSFIPFIGLIEDLFTKNNVIEKEITFASVFPMIELQGFRASKRFMRDTFSRKDNSEVFVIDENKKYYRLLWNENYGSKAEFEKFEKAERLKIQYLMHSRIIVGVEVLD